MLKARYFFLFLLLFLMGCQPAASSPASPPPPPAKVLGQRQYDVHLQISLANEGAGQPEKQNLWVALIRDFPPYQRVLSMEVSPTEYTPIVDEYGNHYAEFDFSKQPAGTTQVVKID